MVQKVPNDSQVQELKLVNCHLCSIKMNYSTCCVDWKSNVKSLACLRSPMQNVHQMWGSTKCYCIAGCHRRGCLIPTAVANLSHKLRVTTEQESVSLFYKYSGKMEGFLLMPHPECFCTDTAGVSSEVSAWGRIQLLVREEQPWPDPAEQQRKQSAAESWGPTSSLFPVARKGIGACMGQPAAWGQGRVKWQRFDKTLLWSAPERPFSQKLLSSSAFPCKRLQFSASAFFWHKNISLKNFWLDSY